jgi:exopolyphosphatase/guanosine-5'-triphosphate,3'-diphosphate pyrophosphatase
MHGAVLTLRQLGKVINDLAEAPTTEERRKLPGIDANRADILLGGAVVLEQVCVALGIEELTISEYALREGVLLDGLHRLRGGTLHHLSELRRASVFHLMELCDDDPEHSVQVSRLALQLHDALGARLGLGDTERELLEAAALLANAGLFISHSGHHKHSYYVIRNSEHLMGFTDREIEVIALVARYHRKSPPSTDKHPEFAALGAEDRAAVRAMAALLRVAIGMDRNHDAAVDHVNVKDEGDVVRIQPVGEPGADLSLEIYTASERQGLLAELLDADVVIEPAT